MATTNAMALCDLMMTSGCATVKDGQPPIFFKTNRTRGLYGLFGLARQAVPGLFMKLNCTWNVDTVPSIRYSTGNESSLSIDIPIDNIYSEHADMENLLHSIY